MRLKEDLIHQGWRRDTGLSCVETTAALRARSLSSFGQSRHSGTSVMSSTCIRMELVQLVKASGRNTTRVYLETILVMLKPSLLEIYHGNKLAIRLY